MAFFGLSTFAEAREIAATGGDGVYGALRPAPAIARIGVYADVDRRKCVAASLTAAWRRQNIDPAVGVRVKF